MRFKAPKYMQETATEEFHRMQSLLEKAGLLDDMDLSLLTDYANTFAEVENLTILVMASGNDYIDTSSPQGRIETPEFSLLNKRREALRKLRTDLGLTVRQRNGRWKVTEGTNNTVSKDDI